MKIKQFTVYILSFGLCLLLAFEAEQSMVAAKSALVLCAERVIPSLFPFFVLSSFMVNTGFVSSAGRCIAPVAKRLFKVSGSGAVVFVMGLLCGYPTGAKMVAELYETKQISKNEAMRLLPFCNNSGPLFVIGAVGGMLGSTHLGLVLYGIHAASAVLTGLAFSMFSKQAESRGSQTVLAVNLGDAFSESMFRGVTTMLNVCGFILFFSVLRAFFLPVIESVFGHGAAGLTVGGMAEVTLGAEAVCFAGRTLSHTLILLSAIIGFGGVCVLLQVWGVVARAGLGIKTYALGKLLQMGISAGIAAILVATWKTVPAFAGGVTLAQGNTPPYMVAVFGGACAYVFLRGRTRKN